MSEDDVDEESHFSKWALPLLPFLLTVFTTLWAGAYQAYSGTGARAGVVLLEHPETCYGGGFLLPARLMLILVTHELGLYLLSRWHRVPASLPLLFLGLHISSARSGQIIRMRGPILHRRALFDVGWPVRWRVLSLPLMALVVGLRWSTVVDRDGHLSGCSWGSRCSCKFVSWLMIGPFLPKPMWCFIRSDLPPGSDSSSRRSISFPSASWTADMSPMLSGGVASGRSRLPFSALDHAGIRGMARVVCVGVHGGSMGVRPPAGFGSPTSIGARESVCGMHCLVVFILTFAPIPFSFH